MLMVGLGSVAAHLAPEAERGRVVGTVMSGLLLGIMLAPPIATQMANLWGWHAVFVVKQRPVQMCKKFERVRRGSGTASPARGAKMESR